MRRNTTDTVIGLPSEITLESSILWMGLRLGTISNPSNFETRFGRSERTPLGFGFGLKLLVSMKV